MVLLLRKITEDDLERIMNWRMIPEVTRYMYTDPQLTIEDQKRWFKIISQDDTSRYWIVQAGQVSIGVVSITQVDTRNQHCCWGHYIAEPSFRGKGLWKIIECNIYDYVFDHLKLNKLWCEVFTFNEKAIAIHQKLGSEVEGILKQHIYKNGVFHDVARIGITKDKWNQIRNEFEYEPIIIE